MDSRVLWLSATFAAAKLAIALWFGQLALSALDRRRVTLAWQIALAATTVVVSGWAAGTSGAPQWWRPVWFISSLLAAAALVDCVRRWITDPPASEPAELPSRHDGASGRQARLSRSGVLEHGRQRVHDAIAWIGSVLTAAGTAVAILQQLSPEMLPRVAAVAELLVCAALLGIVLAASFELTIGATGAVLLGLNWRGLARGASACMLVQLAISSIVILFHRDGATLVESLTPIFFALGMVIVGYIVWAIPRQILALAAKGQVKGQASLAIAGWLAAICLAIACGLPPAWPWTHVRNSRGPIQAVSSSR